MEGNHHSQPIRCNDDLKQALLNFKQNFGFMEVHLTGGEPSIHPEIVDMITLIKKLGMRVKMTTNGQTEFDIIERCIEAGLTDINLSMHTLNAEHLGSLMNPLKDEVWGQRAIDTQLEFIRLFKTQARIKVNTVVVDDEAQALLIAKLAETEGIGWRPMNELEDWETSYKALRRLCCRLGATVMNANIINDSSACSLSYKTGSGFAFKVKLIRDFRLPNMCNNCPVYAAGNCFEGVYGPRLEANEDNLVVRNCIHRNDTAVVISVRDFFNGQSPVN